VQDSDDRSRGQSESDEDHLDQLERQLLRGNLFVHTGLGHLAARLGETESFLYGLIDLLLARGHVSEAELKGTVERIQQELARKNDPPWAGVRFRTDPEAQRPTPVSCESRMHVCRAICCRLDFALTLAEVESGAVKWDLGRPYGIRREANGFCTHNDRKTGFCGIHRDKPAICRAYTCAYDQRIWSDFDRMDLNTEWIEENLAATGPLVLEVPMRWKGPG